MPLGFHEIGFEALDFCGRGIRRCKAFLECATDEEGEGDSCERHLGGMFLLIPSQCKLFYTPVSPGKYAIRRRHVPA